MGEKATPSEKGLITLCEGSILVLLVPSIINLRLAYPLVDKLTPKKALGSLDISSGKWPITEGSASKYGGGRRNKSCLFSWGY